MNPAPVAELWRTAAERLPAVACALVVDVGQPGGQGGCAFLFVVPRPGTAFDVALRAEVHRRCAAAAEGQVPAAIYVVPDLPRASDGRTLDTAVRRMMAGESAPRAAAEEGVANPASLEHFAWLFNNL